MKYKIIFTVMLAATYCASYSANAADDCYYGFKSSSAAQSCQLNSAQFEPGSSNYCRINADCHYYNATTGQDGWRNNNGSWFVGDVRRLINNNGWLEVGNHSRTGETENTSDSSKD